MRLGCSLALLCALALADRDDEAAEKAAREEAAAIARQLSSKEAGERLAAVHDAALSRHPSLAAPLVKMTRDRDRAVRLAAIDALKTIRSEAGRKRAAAALGPRLRPLQAREKDKPELVKVIDALHDLAQPVSIKPLVSSIPRDQERDVVRARLRAVANVPAAEAIERLINFASQGKRNNARRKLALEALGYATGERIRGGPDAWRRWWSENKKTFDFAAAAEKRLEQANTSGGKKKRKRRKKKS